MNSCFYYRYISGLVHLPCQHQKKVSNQCQLLQFAQPMMLICQQQTHVFHVSIYHFIPAKPCFVTNSCWPSKQKTLDLSKFHQGIIFDAKIFLKKNHKRRILTNRKIFLSNSNLFFFLLLLLFLLFSIHY